MKPEFKITSTVYLHPGEACFSKKSIVVSTVLGSCLSITMHCKKIKFSGISHCQLPSCKEIENNCANCTEPYKYVDCTVVKMIQKFEKQNIKREDIEVKIFGGADVLQNVASVKKDNTIGRQNILAAKKSIHKSNLNLVAGDVGGKLGRKLFFLTETGEVFLRKMKNNEKD